MQVITSPNEYTRNVGKYDYFNLRMNVFLGGGITNCPDWQNEFIELIPDHINLNFFNPRRSNWNMYANEDDSTNQIHWENRHLKQSGIIIFWFPEETLCPITLFELGKYLVSNKKLIIGTHPNYQRRFDVIEQTHIERPNTVIHSDIKSMVNELIGYI